MQKPTYSTKANKLTIIDASITDTSLGLNIVEPFDMPLLSGTLQSGTLQSETLQSETSKKALFEKKEGQVVLAYFEKDGKKHGECRSFYPSKEMKSKCFYSEGRLHGPSYFYSKRGHILSETWYVYAKKQGQSFQYYQNKQLCSHLRYNNHQMEGMQEYFYEDGAVKSLIFYKSGLLHQETTLFWNNGKVKRKVFFEEGKREGWDRIFDAKGTLLLEGEYSQNIAIGTHKRYSSLAQLLEEVYYHEPNRSDKKIWSEDGSLVFSGKYDVHLNYLEEKLVDGEWEKREGAWNGKELVWK